MQISLDKDNEVDLKLLGEFQHIIHQQTLNLYNSDFKLHAPSNIPEILCNKRVGAPDTLWFYQNKYLRLEQIGTGGQGKIFLCYDVE